ncbi:YesL family protein [Gracilibacillus alcaliphilus]|uniref:YesL family protein n=1 Tax=Gracilibacillus alcaliphilus TaxID=1401441 RepID=UPI0019587524|nr:DUF624 domain-containing protein [Gracilibacillus alcaliphilus]MBM7677549.1 putative membrane protein YesL [Gracilibacillus alcaliphilus]
MDNRLYSFMEWMYRLVYVNVLWLLFSLPVITAIPSFYAMLSIIDKWKNDEKDFAVFSQFTSECKRYFWKSYQNSLLYIIIIGVLIIDFSILRNSANESLIVISYALLTLAALLIMVTFYAVPISVKFSLKHYKVMMLSLALMIKQPVRSLTAIVIPIFSIALLLVQTGFGILFLGSFTAYFMVTATNKGLKKIYGNHPSMTSTVKPQSS